jgi:2-C-methyl-D-erythritol 4-phosphate cytidylyltransferase
VLRSAPAADLIHNGAVSQNAGAVGIVPVGQDDRQAPAGCAALRVLRGVPLVRRAVGALARSGAVGQIVVVVPPALADPITDLLVDLDVRVLPVRENGPGHRVLAALYEVLHDREADLGPAPDGESRLVVVHDPLHPLAPAELVRAVLTRLGEAPPHCHAVVPVRPVTDTLKWVDEDDVVTSTVDRGGYRMVYSPQAYRPAALLAALEVAGGAELRAPGADVLPRLVQGAGGGLLSVPAPGEVFRIATEDDLLLAEAMLHVGVDADEEPSPR